MDTKARAPTRKAKQLRVPVLPDEDARIKRLALAAGLPVAAYLRNAALGHRMQGMLDQQCVEQLARINGDLGRLGGLLKLWLTDDPRTAQFGEATIRAVLSKIEETQAQMQAVMRAVVMLASRSGRI